MGKSLELSLMTLPRGDIRDNFQKILEAFNGLVLESGNWRFYELEFMAAATNYRLKHHFTFTPKDIIQTGKFGTGAVTFNFDEFDATYIDITTTAACVVRFFAGLRSESLTLGQTGSIGSRSGTGGGSGGISSVLDTNSIDLTLSGGVTLSADLRLSATAATAGFFLATTTIKGGGSPGLHVELPIATTSLTGVISSTDWNTFNNKVSTSRQILTTSPLSGGGDLSADRTIVIANAAADGVTKGAAAFTAADFNASSGVISIDYTNGQAASAVNKGFLTSADWTTFNNKVTNAFTTIACPAGTNPVADSATDTLTLSTDGSVTITGTAGTDTIAFSIVTYLTASLATITLQQAYNNATNADPQITYNSGDNDIHFVIVGQDSAQTNAPNIEFIASAVRNGAGTGGSFIGSGGAAQDNNDTGGPAQLFGGDCEGKDQISGFVYITSGVANETSGCSSGYAKIQTGGANVASGDIYILTGNSLDAAGTSGGVESSTGTADGVTGAYTFVTGASASNNSGGMSFTTGTGTSTGGFTWTSGAAFDDTSGSFLWQMGDSAGDSGSFTFNGSSTPANFTAFIISNCDYVYTGGDHLDFNLATTNGTKWGTSSSQKQAWWGATPAGRSSGWGSITNVTPDKAYNANSTTVDELADVLGTLIAQLVSYGLLGS